MMIDDNENLSSIQVCFFFCGLLFAVGMMMGADIWRGPHGVGFRPNIIPTKKGKNKEKSKEKIIIVQRDTGKWENRN